MIDAKDLYIGNFNPFLDFTLAPSNNKRFCPNS